MSEDNAPIIPTPITARWQEDVALLGTQGELAFAQLREFQNGGGAGALVEFDLALSEITKHCVAAELDLILLLKREVAIWRCRLSS